MKKYIIIGVVLVVTFLAHQFLNNFLIKKYTYKSIRYFDLVSSAQLEPLGPIFRQCSRQSHLRRTPACGRRRGPELGEPQG